MNEERKKGGKKPVAKGVATKKERERERDDTQAL